MFYDNYLRLCNTIKKKPSTVAVELGLSKSLVSRWKRGGGISDATAQKVADYFGVTVDELTGEEKKEKADPQTEIGLDETTKRLIAVAKDGTQEEIDKIIEYAAFLRSQRDKG